MNIVEMVKKRKFQYFVHYVHGGGIARTMMEGGMEGRCKKGRLQGNWMGNLREWCECEQNGVSRS